MLNCHTFVVTGSKPWTTIHPLVIGTELEMLDLCPVKLIHLGQYMFSKLIPKQRQLLTDPNILTMPPTKSSAIPASLIQFLREEESDKMDKPASVPTLTLPCANTDNLSKDQVIQKENDKTTSEPTMISDDRSKDQVNQKEKN